MKVLATYVFTVIKREAINLPDAFEGKFESLTLGNQRDAEKLKGPSHVDKENLSRKGLSNNDLQAKNEMVISNEFSRVTFPIRNA